MRHMILFVVFAFLTSGIGLGCDDPDAEEEAPDEETHEQGDEEASDEQDDEEQAAAEEDVFEEFEVEELGITIDGPPDTEFTDLGEGFHGGDDDGIGVETEEFFGEVTLLASPENDAADLEEAKEEIQSRYEYGDHVLREIDGETLDNGWIATFTVVTERSDERPDVDSHYVLSYHEIDGDDVQCITGSLMESAQEEAERICRSIS